MFSSKELRLLLSYLSTCRLGPIAKYSDLNAGASEHFVQAGSTQDSSSFEHACCWFGALEIGPLPLSCN